MLKNILNLDGAQKLTKNEQKNISGGMVAPDSACPSGTFSCNCMGKISCESSVNSCWNNC